MKKLENYPELLRILRENSPAGENYADRAKELEEKSGKNEMIVPILGTQGTGKSTFLSSLLGEDILPSEADETTCVPVEIRYGLEEKGVVFFSDNKPEKYANTKKDLSLYVDNQYNYGNEKKVDHIVLYRKHNLLKNGLVLVDLPGVGSLTKNNEKTTMNYINNLCVAVFIISTCPPITNCEAQFISNVWRRFGAVYFVQNIWDDHSEKEVEDGLSHNRLELQDIASKINAPMVKDIVPVNVYKAAVGAFQNDVSSWKKSGIETFIKELEDFSVNYQVRQKEQVAKRIEEFSRAAFKRLSAKLDEADMSHDELLMHLQEEKQNKTDKEYNLEKIINRVKEILLKGRNQNREFARSLKNDYSKLLEVDTFNLIEGGVVDGDNLNNAFQNYQSKYAEEAMDKVASQFDNYWNDVYQILKELKNNFGKEDLKAVKSENFEKAEATKWEKGAEAVIDIMGSIGGGAAGLAITGPWGVVAGIGISIISGCLGNFTKNLVVSKRIQSTKDEIKPYIKQFGDRLYDSVIDGYNRFYNQIIDQLAEYRKSVNAEITELKNRIENIQKKGIDDINKSKKVIEADLNYIKEWLENNGRDI